MGNEADILAPVLETALKAWEADQQGKTLLTYSLSEAVLAPLEAAIEKCDAFQKVAGKPIFSGYSGVIITNSVLAPHLLSRADPKYSLGIPAAIEWFKRILTTEKTKGFYEVAIWGIQPDAAVEVMGRALLPYDNAPDMGVKKRVNDVRWKGGGGAVWYTPRFYEEPGAIMTLAVDDFPYLGRPDRSFQRLGGLDAETRDLLAFMQASLTGQHIVAASWFYYEDVQLDFNSHENHLSWCVPEVEPVVYRHVPVKAEEIGNTVAAFLKLHGDYQKKIIRSAERFTLSQCRHRTADKILDLAIAFEMLTSSEGEYAPPGLKVGIRSAQLIGGPLEYRQKVRKALGALYTLRNKATHGGSLKSAEIADQEAMLMECGGYYRALFDSLLNIGEPPDWAVFDLEPRHRE